MTGFASTVEIYVDEKGGGIKNGASFTLDLAPGVHEVVAMCQNPGGGVIERGDTFEVSSGQSVEYELGFGSMRGFYFKRV